MNLQETRQISAKQNLVILLR